MSDSQNLVNDLQKEALERVNTSGYRYAPYETQTERLERENRELRSRIAELEAAAQWHPASEPPEKYGAYLVACYDYIAIDKFNDRGWHYADTLHMKGWRDLPPLPVKP